MRAKLFIVVLIVLLFISSAASAHSGRTDSAGGHYNRSTGEYHFHHGYPAHQHPGGVCPYETKPTVKPTEVPAVFIPEYVPPPVIPTFSSPSASPDDEAVDYKDLSEEQHREISRLRKRNEFLSEFIDDLVAKHNAMAAWFVFCLLFLAIAFIISIISYKRLKKRK